ncbi:nucleoside-diphosphate-sugar epimerase [Niveomyces insectorum RCEF 264]|uniref:Nucleoside-diphosphate-sugar epimerase n=1 Tax=Niveomyces insectorum RCEF 264 TaxID=1081102 RepID=A0A167UP89_9HYPO|nr:nucleoside-diphosphate-sugar epimerase [Niveomyces insectorum RCEF 264]
MHLILTGATGLVGSGVLDAMLAMPEITRISILSRRPVPQLEARVQARDPLVVADPARVQVLQHTDFATYSDAVLESLRGATGVVWALGISQTAVSKEDYVTITYDYPLAAAKAFQRIPQDNKDAQRQPFRFVYVSGEGATATPGPLTTLYGRVKGETETALAKLTNDSSSNNNSNNALVGVSVRPAAVDATHHPAIQPYVPQLSLAFRALRVVVLPALRTVYSAMISPTRPLGQFLAEVAMGKHDDRINGAAAVPGVEHMGKFAIVSNVAFRRIAGLDGRGQGNGKI